MAKVTGRCLVGQFLATKGWTQRQLAEKANVSRSSISDYIRQNNIMSLVHAKNIADALECNIEDLYEWVPTNRADNLK